MANNSKLIKTVGTLAAVSFSLGAFAGVNAGDVFEAKELNAGFMMADQTNLSEGSCGEASCGEESRGDKGDKGDGKKEGKKEGKKDDKRDGKKDDKDEEGTCGEGTCGEA